MTLSPAGLELIQRWEACELAAYLDSGDLPTIGWGTTRYPDGTRVKMGDTCTQEQADMWLREEVRRTERTVDDLTIDTLTVRQFDALVSMAYNCGTAGFRKSTLRRRVNLDPYDPAIRPAFLMWVYDNGDFVQGLLNRRTAEADHYFGVKTI
jgi:lysozyme